MEGCKALDFFIAIIASNRKDRRIAKPVRWAKTSPRSTNSNWERYRVQIEEPNFHENPLGNLDWIRLRSNATRADTITPTNIVNNLVQQGIIKKPYENNIPETEYKNLQTLYYNVANIFINYLLNGTTEFTEFISFDTLFGNNAIKFIPDFEQWKINIDKIPLYPEKTGGRSLKRKAVSGGTRKGRKNRCRKNSKTKKCMKKKYNKKR